MSFHSILNVRGFGTTSYSESCFASNCVGRNLPKSHNRTGWRRTGSPITAQPIEVIRHLQAAGDWANAARLLADHSFSLTLDGHTGTINGLVRAFPRRAWEDDAELALVYATQDSREGRLDEAATRLELAEQHARTAPTDRQHRLKVAVGSMKLELAMRRGHFEGSSSKSTSCPIL